MRRIKWVLIAVSVALALAALMAGAQGGKAQSDPPVWGLVAGVVPATVSLNTVFMVDQNNAWVGGADAGSGELYRLQFANNAWHVIERQSFQQAVLALSAITGDDVWVVGESGLLAHRVPGSGWFTLETPVPNATLKTIQMFGAGDEGWIGGDRPTGSTKSPLMLHYKNGEWLSTAVQDPAGNYRSVNSLHFMGDSGFAAGSDNIWRYN